MIHRILIGIIVIVSNKINILPYLCFIIISLTSCDKGLDSDIDNEDLITFVELNASQYMVSPIDSSLTGKYEKFNFFKGDTVNDDNWDVAFRGSTIIINGGEKSNNDQPDRTGNAAVYIAIGTMHQIKKIDTNNFLQDNITGLAIIDDLGISGNGWASYNINTHILSPIPGRILVFRTYDNKYAKMEIRYFYDSPNPQPSNGDYGGYYTFDYLYQSDGDLSFY